MRHSSISLKNSAKVVAWLALAAASCAASAAAPEQLLLEVKINGQLLPEPQLLVRGHDGGVYASAAALKSWRLNLDAADEMLVGGESYRRINGPEGAKIAISEADQSIRIDASPELFESHKSSLSRTEELAMTPSSLGGFVNYDMFAQVGSGPEQISGAFEFVAFSQYGVGTTRVITSMKPDANLTRLDSSWVIDRPGRMWSVRLGDSLTRAGSDTAPLHFAGLQVGRNFALQPGFVTLPLPSIDGSAAVPSVADVYVNNMLHGSSGVAPGPFEIRNVPIQTGAGQVQLVVRDVLGREVISSQSYYASSEMLRRGLHDFSFDIGFLRHNFGIRSNDYRGFIASTTHRYGLTDTATMEGHLQVTLEQQSAGVRATGTLGNFVLLNAGASASRSALGMGWKLSGGAERRSSGLSLGVRSELANALYAQAGGAGDQSPRFSLQGFADVPLGGTSVGVNLSHRNFHNQSSQTFVGAFTTLRLGSLGSLQLFARRAYGERSNAVLGGHWAMTLGARRSVSSSLEWSRNGRSSAFSIQQDAPFGSGFGYRASVTTGQTNTLDGSFNYQGTGANLSVEASQVDTRRAARITASGAVGFVAGEVFASRALTSSFAAVRVPGFKGVRVYADNHLVGTTDQSGTLMVPALRPFEKNAIRIDESDLPLDVYLAEVERAVRPYSRSGSLIEFKVRREKGALLSVRLEDGSDLPVGAEVVVEGLEEPFVAVLGGEVYVRLLAANSRAYATWAGRTCSFAFSLPSTEDVQPRITGLICVEGPRLASR